MPGPRLLAQRGGQFVRQPTIRIHLKQSQGKRPNLARKRPVFGLSRTLPGAWRLHPLSAPGGFASATDARLCGAAAVTLRPSDAHPDTRVHGSPCPSTSGSPPARDTDTTLWVCLPRATRTSGATDIYALTRLATPDRGRHGPRCGWRHMGFPRGGTGQGVVLALVRAAPIPLPRLLTRTEPERFLSLRRRFRGRDQSLRQSCANPLGRIAWPRLGLASASSSRAIPESLVPHWYPGP